MYWISSSGTKRKSCGKEEGEEKERRTAIDDDALGDAERRVRRHLHGTQMTRREPERAKFGGTVSWRVVACFHQEKNLSSAVTRVGAKRIFTYRGYPNPNGIGEGERWGEKR